MKLRSFYTNSHTHTPILAYWPSPVWLRMAVTGTRTRHKPTCFALPRMDTPHTVKFLLCLHETYYTHLLTVCSNVCVETSVISDISGCSTSPVTQDIEFHYTECKYLQFKCTGFQNHIDGRVFNMLEECTTACFQ